MPIIYYAYYTPISDSIPEICDQEHLLGRRLLAEGLRSLCHTDLSDSELAKILRTTEAGKPWLSDFPGLHFNITHCDGLAACAFDRFPIGADAELPGYFAEILIRRALCEQEKGFLRSAGATPVLRKEWFYRFWTLKEAYVKKAGIGVDVDLTGFSFQFIGEEDPFRIQCSDRSVLCWQKKLSSGHILSLCHENPGEEIRLRECRF